MTLQTLVSDLVFLSRCESTGWGALMLSHQTFQKFSHKQPTGVHTQRKYTLKLLYWIFNILGL